MLEAIVDDLGESMFDLTQEMGVMANPVTRSSAGSLYHQELARQLAEFLGKGKGQGGDLKGRDGMLTLHDAFCLFNRSVRCLACLPACSPYCTDRLLDRTGH